jgi:glycosyltransferase involved in cell wall biosynthesis
MLNDAYSGAFVAWFAARKNEEFPYRSSDELRFAHHDLSEVGYWKLFQNLRADREAVVILGGWSSPMTNRTLLMTTLLRIPVFIWADHPHPRKRSWIAAGARKLYLRFLARVVSGFLACGNPTVEHLASLGITRSKITNFPYWVELRREWSSPKRCFDQESAKQPLRLLAIGRLVPVKQFEVAIEAVALANRQAGRELADIVVVGDGPERTSLDRLAQSRATDVNVSFRDWLEMNQVYAALRQADALVLTSKFDAYGVVVLEAMAAGRTVLASVGVIAARDRDEGTGAVLIHPIGDVECLAEQIKLLGTDRERLRKASLAARATAEKWPPIRACAILDKLFERTARGKLLLQKTKTSAAGSERVMAGVQERIKSLAAVGGVRR